MIERVARALAVEVDRQARVGKWAGDIFVPDNGPLNMHSFARAAIEAMREPTSEMTQAAQEAREAKRRAYGWQQQPVEAWQAMIDTALKG